MSRWASSAWVCGLAAFVAGMLSASTTFAQAAPPPAPAEKAKPIPGPFEFTGDAALTLHFIKADKVADFEMLVAKLKEALDKSDKPERAEQAASWHIFKAGETGVNGASIYAFVIAPVVEGSDYTLSTILAEGFADDVQSLFRKLADCYTSVNVLNLSLVVDFGQ